MNIKLFIAASILTIISSFAYADSLNFAKGWQQNANDTKSNQYTFKYIHDVNSKLDVDVLASNMKNTTTLSGTQLYEVGARYKVPIKFPNRSAVYLRGALGSLQPANKSNMNYTGVEVGILSKPLNNNVLVRLDYTIMSGTNTDRLDNKYSRVWLGYELSKKRTVAIRRDFMRGDLTFDTWHLLYSIKF
jgi:hypothetical protein